MPKVADVKGRSAITGRQLGRSAIRAKNKNAVAVDEFLTSVERAGRVEDLEWLVEEGLWFARVVKAMGCGRLEVQMPDGVTANITIAGAVRFRGSAASKGDRENCMSSGDYVVVRGAQAAGKLSNLAVQRTQAVIERVGMKVAPGYFSGVAGAEEDDDVEWDRTEEADAEAEAEAETKNGDDAVDIDAI